MSVYIIISVLVLIVCVLLIFAVLIQNAKGGGLAPNFAANNQIMGVRKTTDIVEKATWTLAVALAVLTLASTFVIPKGQEGEVRRSEIQDRIPATNMSPDFAAPVAPPAEAVPQLPEEME